MRFFLTLLTRALLGVLILLVVLYVGDYASLKLQIPKRPPTTDLQIQPLISVPEKGNKTEYMLGDPQVQTCSNSLFPQLGLEPCWYLSRHTEQRIHM